MTEPVAYIVNGVAFNDINRAKFYSDVLKYHKKIKIGVESLVPIPLYTEEQLHPRVKMTQAEFDEFLYFYERYRVDTTTIAMLSYIRINKDGETKNLYHRFYDIGTLDVTVEAQLEFALLWARFDKANPEETIEIIPDMKWFVRSKEKYQPDMDQGISESGYLYLTQGDIYSVEYHEMTTFKDEAQQFNTKEEAELWLNPLTEAVQLPVEDE